MVIKRIGPMSCARIAGPVYAILGLFAGVFISLAALLGMAASEDRASALGGAIFGLGAIFVLPVAYGLIGFLGALLGAWIYNLMAAAVGGVEIDIS